jgi:hypothetical protein
MRDTGWIVTAAAVMVMLTSCAPSGAMVVSTGGSAPPSAESPVSAGTSVAAIAVTPATRLVDGQTVHVVVMGFEVGEKVWLSECPTSADVTPFGCGAGLPELPFLITDDKGDAAGSFTVSTTFTSPTGGPAPCAPCVLAAVSGQRPGVPPSPTASTPLAFASSSGAALPPTSGSSPPPSVSATTTQAPSSAGPASAAAASSPGPPSSLLASPDTTLFPAHGCGVDNSPIITVTVNPDGPVPNCAIVTGTQRLRVVNATNAFSQPGMPITVTFGRLQARVLQRGQSTIYSSAFGDYLAPGEHYLDTSNSPGSGIVIWLK